MSSFELKEYKKLLADIKVQVRFAQQKAMISANAAMIQMYWQIGLLVDKRQKEEGWGATIIPRLAADLKNDHSNQQGFSARNLKRMLAFYREYPSVPQPAAQFEFADLSLVFMVSWSHNIILLERVKDMKPRLWYMRQILEQGWSRDELTAQIKNDAYALHGNELNNFSGKRGSRYAEQVRQNLRGPYIFDFLTTGDDFTKRKLESDWTRHIPSIFCWPRSTLSQSARCRTLERINGNYCGFFKYENTNYIKIKQLW